MWQPDHEAAPRPLAVLTAAATRRAILALPQLRKLPALSSGPSVRRSPSHLIVEEPPV